MIRACARIALLVWAVFSVAMSGWLLAQHPFAQPMIARSATEARAAFDRAMVRTVTPEWLDERLATAIRADDPDRALLLAEIGADHGLEVPPRHREALAEMSAGQSGLGTQIAECGACAVDITACRTLSRLAACALPFEMSPLGDLNALRRAGVAWALDEDVDEIEAALAGLGLGATAAVLVTGGASAPAKFGATLLRMGRRMGAISPGLMRTITRATGNRAELTAIVTDLGRLRESTSTTEALVLLRHADDARDLSRLNRVAEAAGPETRKVMEVLGKARSFRLIDRLSNLALAAVGFIALVAGQIITLLLAGAKLVIRRALRGGRKGPRRAVA